MNEPLEWEKVPVKGTDMGVTTYRSLVDGQGWLVLMFRNSHLGGSGEAPFASYFVPDPNMKWGVESETVDRKDRWS